MTAFIADYFLWHYGRAYKEALSIWKTMLWFTLFAFRVRLHFFTLFARFHRLGESYKSMGFDVGKILSAWLVNTIMRLIGVILRLIVIVCGLIAWCVVLIGGAIFFVVWTLAPLLIIGFIGFGAFAFIV